MAKSKSKLSRPSTYNGRGSSLLFQLHFALSIMRNLSFGGLEINSLTEGENEGCEELCCCSHMTSPVWGFISRGGMGASKTQLWNFIAYDRFQKKPSIFQVSVSTA